MMSISMKNVLKSLMLSLLVLNFLRQIKCEAEQTMILKLDHEDDDVEFEFGGNCWPIGSILNYGRTQNEKISLVFRFREDEELPNKRISTARLKLTAAYTQSGLVAYDIRAAKNSNSLTDLCYFPKSSDVTSAAVTWYFGNFTTDEIYTSPDISYVIKEAFKGEYLIQNNAIGIVLIFNDAGSCQCDAQRGTYSYSGSNGDSSRIPTLELVFSEFSEIDSTLNLKLHHDNNDVELEFGGSCWPSGTVLNYGRTFNQKLSLAFNFGEELPNKTLSSAHLKLTSSYSKSGLVAYDIKAFMTAHSPTDLCYFPESAAMTSAVATWSFSTFATDEVYRSPDISHVIKEALQGDYWLQNYAVRLVLIFNDARSCQCDAERGTYSALGARGDPEKVPTLELQFSDQVPNEVTDVSGHQKYIFPFGMKKSKDYLHCTIIDFNKETNVTAITMERNTTVQDAFRCISSLPNEHY